MVYRVWSSIRSKQCLRYLLQLVPHTLLGNMPKRSPKQMWYRIQEIVEFSHAIEAEAAGAVIDITKCFNALPRIPLLEIAEHIGLPPCVLQPWRTALSMFQRRFQVRSATGAALPSNCGFPEGCGLSTVAMAVINLTCELWMFYKNPSIRVWSFVDNIETLTNTAEEACDSLELLSQFCELLDLQVDHAKSYCWANTAEGRKVIRDRACSTKLFARDLGGHMNYARLRTNRTITQKIGDLQPFWHRAARSCAPAAHKQRAILTAAWPNLFYGISTVTIGACHFDRLRTLVSKALGATQAGVNPMLFLSCLHKPKLDPEYYCIFQTVMSYRACATADLASHTMTATVLGQATSQGPCASLFHSLHKLSWSWEHDDLWRDHNGALIDIVAAPKATLEDHLQQAWHLRVMAILEDLRKTMTGATLVDVDLTMECYLALPNDHRGLMKCALNGAQFTNDALAHANLAPDATCRFCSSRDSPEHRHWHCPFFQDIRKQYPMLDTLDRTEAACLLNHGWLPESKHWVLHQANLDALPDTTQECLVTREFNSLRYHDLFLDGSCIFPNDRRLRIASWGMVIWTGHSFIPLATGGVRGRRQTSLRGE